MNQDTLTPAQRERYIAEFERLQTAIAPHLADAAHDVALGVLLSLYRALALRFTCCTLGCAEKLTDISGQLLEAHRLNVEAGIEPAAMPMPNPNLH